MDRFSSAWKTCRQRELHPSTANRHRTAKVLNSHSGNQALSPRTASDILRDVRSAVKENPSESTKPTKRREPEPLIPELVGPSSDSVNAA